MIPMSDRRKDERFDVVGAMWGVLELNEPARIENVSLTGALIDSPVSAALGSTHPLRLIVDGQEVKVEGLVRHVRGVQHLGREERYFIGVEFSAPPVHVTQAIEQLGSEQAQEPTQS